MTAQMERRELLAEDGTRCEASLFRSELGAVAPAIVCMPAMGARAAFYRPLAEQLRAAGFHALTAELRGHGTSSARAGRGVHYGYKEMLEQDYPRVLAAAREAFPGSPVFLLGHSLGGQLGALYLSLHPEEAEGLILLAACSVHYRNWGFPRGLGVLAFTQLARAISEVWGYFPGRTLHFGGSETREVIRDWSHQARTGRWQPAGLGVDFDRRLGALERPVLAISIEADVLAPARAVEDLCGRLTKAQVSRWHCTPEEFGARKLDHFRWVRTPGPVVEHVRAWVDGLQRH